MALEGPLSGMFPDTVSRDLVPQSYNTYLMCLARCSLRVKLNLHGGNSVQKNLWPFFFLDTRPVSGSTLSASEASSPSSESPISTSCEPVDCIERRESPRVTISGPRSRDESFGEENELRKGESGKGL